uniref:IBR domain-containing protein n=1 Tax=Oryza brachyantha TaxID=4533 RepID=J3MW59_ORYBR
MKINMIELVSDRIRSVFIPACRFFVERYDGCVHITCRCEMQFCYGCGREWNSADHSCCHEPAP